ncbi:MAG TPA: rRNA maturation RNase YbeY [Acidimicrobiales bacterium]|nr:rRNA maturation RNase YbeY [Acidimicrobiales bacterium]
MSGADGQPPPALSSHASGADVVGYDEQSEVEVDVECLVDLARGVLGAEGLPGGCELSLRLVDEDAMTVLNRDHMDGDGPTDVLAFPIDGLDAAAGGAPAGGAPGMPLLLGDVVVCPAVARRNAVARGAGTGDELALLVVHGILHLLGMDHAERDEAAAMQARQRALLTELRASDG